VLSTPAPHTRDETPTLTNRWGDSNIALNGRNLADYDDHMCWLCMQLVFSSLCMVLHRKTCSCLKRFTVENIEGHRTSKSHRGRIRKQRHMRSPIPAQRFLCFSTILRFALIRYHGWICRQFGDAMRQIVKFSDFLRSFRAFWLKIQ